MCCGEKDVKKLLREINFIGFESLNLQKCVGVALMLAGVFALIYPIISTSTGVLSCVRNG